VGLIAPVDWGEKLRNLTQEKVKNSSLYFLPPFEVEICQKTGGQGGGGGSGSLKASLEITKRGGHVRGEPVEERRETWNPSSSVLAFSGRGVRNEPEGGR